MVGLEYLDGIYDLLQGITLNEPSIFLATRSFEDSEQRFTELPPDIDDKNTLDQADLHTVPEPVAQSSGPTTGCYISEPNSKGITKR
jgi:hypothetical protein